mmetsp:Transcript_18600/g.28026  ORF Transcript_18600/g.28026 Transcript_18600/m.28026 type:complete len:285 (+) Transcript_18600:2240-3094(+)
MMNENNWDWTATYKKWEAWTEKDTTNENNEEIRNAARLCMGCRNLDRSDERRVYELPTEEKIRLCRVFRGRGDIFIREGQFFRASLWYRKSLSYYEYTFPEIEDEIKELDETRFAVLIALAHCDFRHKLYRQVLNHCYQALQINPNHTDVLLLRIKTYIYLDEYQAATNDLDALHDPASNQAKILRATLNNRQQAYQSRSKVQSQRIVQALVGGNHKDEPFCPQQHIAPASSASEKHHYKNLLREAHAVIPRPLPVRDRDALDNLYTPLETVSHIHAAINRRQL